MKTEAFMRARNPLQEVQVTSLPTFNHELASLAKQDTQKLGIDPHLYPSLIIASNLAYYNFRSSAFPKDMRTERMLDLRLGDLCRKEQEAAENEALPTIGVEIETPRLPFYNHRAIFPSEYKSFFDSIHMERNRINADAILNQGDVEYWEFSPAPSFSPTVQARIISELVQGGFIPSLLNSQNPSDIETHLDTKLVSMHINIGFPPNLPILDAENLTALRNLGIALAISYSSAKRLEKRKMKDHAFVIKKQAQPTQKNCPAEPYLFELKAMELRTELAYYALYTTQLLFASFFKSRLNPSGKLAEIWSNLETQIDDFFFEKKFKIIPTNPTETSNEAARLTQRGAGNEMRKILEKTAREVKRSISSSESQ